MLEVGNDRVSVALFVRQHVSPYRNQVQNSQKMSREHVRFKVFKIYGKHSSKSSVMMI